MRYEKNPLRMLDCKNEKCQEIFIKDEVKKVILGEFICDECKNHFDELKKYLDEGKVNYKINKMLVRGLDYYNRTVFEIKSENLGSQNAVAGGGRYDSLISTLSDENVPAIGFAMGVERLQSLLPIKNEKKIDYYIISDNKTETVKLAQKLRNEGKIVDFDFNNKKFIKQLEKASKVANFGIILGEDEIKNNYLTIKNFETGEQEKVSRMRQPE